MLHLLSIHFFIVMHKIIIPQVTICLAKLISSHLYIVWCLFLILLLLLLLFFVTTDCYSYILTHSSYNLCCISCIISTFSLSFCYTCFPIVRAPSWSPLSFLASWVGSLLLWKDWLTQFLVVCSSLLLVFMLYASNNSIFSFSSAYSTSYPISSSSGKIIKRIFNAYRIFFWISCIINF